MEQGLAAVSSGVTNTYGAGEDQNTKHFYAGVSRQLAKKKKKKKKGTSNGR